VTEHDPHWPTVPDTAMDGAPPEPATIRFVAQPSMGELIWHQAELARRAAPLIVLGTFVTVTSAITLVLGDATSIIGLLLGLSLLSGLFAAPFVWWAVRQRRDLLLAPVTYEIDDEGISMTTSSSTARSVWSVFRRARETRRAFVLDTGAGAAIVLLKRPMGPEVVESVRERLRRRGLLLEPTLVRRMRPLVWVGVGLLAVAVVFGGSLYLANAGANVALETTPTVASRHVTVDGTTDLPDGTRLAVQVFQFDAWNRARASGDAAAADDFSYIDEVEAVVHGGRFSADVDMTGWPAGHGMSAVYFWIDESQPQEVIDRFGLDGSGLHGPNVLPHEDTGPTLRVDHGFDIPQ
jgi:hypothetical protein